MILKAGHRFPPDFTDLLFLVKDGSLEELSFDSENQKCY